MSSYWTPAVPTVGLPSPHRRPEVGTLVALGRKPYRVVSVTDVAPAFWDDHAAEMWRGRGMPDPWPSAPFHVEVSDPSQGDQLGRITVQPWHYDALCSLPEHYAVCSRCGELAPCREITAQRAAIPVMQRLDRLASTLPGCCWGCREPVTSRQESVTFPFENAWLPTAPPPTFHLRRQCRAQAAAYERDWVAVDSETRPRSLLTMTCTGSLIVHHDGSAECFGAVDSDCPDARAAHASYSACYAQSHGCPRDCPREGHPGCAVRGART